MADAGCSFHYESAEERVREVRDENTYENIERHQTAPDPQPSTTKDKPRSLVFVSVIAGSLLVLFGLAIAGIVFVSQEKLRLDEAKNMYDKAAAELHGQDRKLNDSLLGKLENEVKELRSQNRKLNDSLLEKLELDVNDSSHLLQQMIQSRASKQNRTINDLQRLIQDNKMRQNRTYLELLKELHGQDRKLNDSLLRKLETEVEELHSQNRKLNDSLLEKLELDVKDSSHLLQQMIQSRASKQNQTINDLQRLIQDNQMKQNRSHVELLKGATSCDELRNKYGVLESGIYRMKQNGSLHPVYNYCDFQIRTGKYACEDLLYGLGAQFEAGYFWIRENQIAQPSFKYCFKSPSSCKKLVQIFGPTFDGIYSIYPASFLRSIKLYCDSNGWTVFQRRKDGSVDFYRGWDEYVNGFGDMNGEFWLGLETIYQLTEDGDYELRVDLTDFDGNKVYAQYGHFSISPASDKYRINISSYSGNAGDSLANHNGMQFTARDNDNDNSERSNCAVSHKGGWWYNGCHYSNLNGKYYSSAGSGTDGVTWYRWENAHQYLKFAEMKFRKKH